MKQKVLNNLAFIGGIFFMVLGSVLFAMIRLNVVEFKIIYLILTYIAIPLIFVIWLIILELINKGIMQSKEIKKIKEESEQRKKEVDQEYLATDIKRSYLSRILISKFVVLKRNRDKNIEEILERMNIEKELISEKERELKSMEDILALYHNETKLSSEEVEKEKTETPNIEG